MGGEPVTAMRVVVIGRVQGVGFRWAARRAAERIGVSGWVRNRDDGSVEAHVEGESSRVQAMRAWLEAGPDGSSVRGVEVAEADAEGLAGFEIRP